MAVRKRSASDRAAIASGMRAMHAARRMRLAELEQREAELMQEIEQRESERDRLHRRITELETSLAQAHQIGRYADIYGTANGGNSGLGDRERDRQLALLDYIRQTGARMGSL